MPVPLLDLKIQYANLKTEIDAAVKQVMESGNFILGENVKQLENEIARYCGVKYGAGVASGTDALLLALLALGVGEGDEVITTPFTFIATIEAITKVRAKVVFADIDDKTYNIDPAKIEEKITAKTKAIIPVHLYGQACDMGPIMELAKKRKIYVIEDCAQAIGAEYKGQKVGSIGHIGCFSFFPSKNLGCYGDGGMVISNDEELIKKVKIIRVHGSDKKYHHIVDGYNSRLDEIQAAILRIKNKHLEDWTKKRRVIADKYNEVFNSLGKNGMKIIVPFELPGTRHVYCLYTIRIKERDKLHEYLNSKGIGNAVHYPIPLHLQEVCQKLGHKKGDFPVAEQCAAEVLSLPLFPELNDGQIKEVFTTVASY
jgi:dTDP-4-amino-4,6-dideoxygalactose transaminase